MRGTWGSAAVPGLEPSGKDDVVEKVRMKAPSKAASLKSLSRAGGRDTIIDTGAGPTCRLSTPPAPADKGYFVIVPEDCC